MINLRDQFHRPLPKIQLRTFGNYLPEHFLTQKSKLLQLKHGLIQYINPLYMENSNLRSKKKHFKVSSLCHLNNNNNNNTFRKNFIYFLLFKLTLSHSHLFS